MILCATSDRVQAARVNQSGCPKRGRRQSHPRRDRAPAPPRAAPPRRLSAEGAVGEVEHPLPVVAGDAVGAAAADVAEALADQCGRVVRREVALRQTLAAEHFPRRRRGAAGEVLALGVEPLAVEALHEQRARRDRRE